MKNLPFLATSHILYALIAPAAAKHNILNRRVVETCTMISSNLFHSVTRLTLADVFRL